MIPSSAVDCWALYYTYARRVKGMCLVDAEQYADERTMGGIHFKFTTYDYFWSIEAMIYGVTDVYTAEGWIKW